ncbi:histone H1-I [Drosophila novamexicana]|uniref:histone H1-I n=1 Tax=Drosophila novamexicana TaxID=47314 RepID=UPI0011E5A742|nr:histone H1-I [Drosophila novamexicana]
MRLLSNKHIGSSEDEESDEEIIENETSDESEQSDEEEPEKSEHPFTADSQSNDEDSVEEEDNGEHPYPTPPPDAEGNISLGNGLKKITIKDSKPKMAKETKTNMAGPKKTKAMAESKKEPAPAPTSVNSAAGTSEPVVMNAAKKGSILAHSLTAIRALNSRSGSSVLAIIKYMKSNGYEVTDARRMAKSVQRALKIAVAKGEVEQVRRSFKLSPAAKLASKAKQNMKAKRQKKMAKEKAPKAATKPEAEKTEKAKAAPPPAAAQEKPEKPMQRKKKASERSTNEPPKKKANAKLAGAAGKAKAAQIALEEESTKPKPKAKPAKNALVSPDVTPTSEDTAMANSKMPRKSIGTLAQNTARPKLQTKSIKKLVSGKRNVDEVDSGLMDSVPNEASTPIAAVKQKRTGRQMK